MINFTGYFRVVKESGGDNEWVRETIDSRENYDGEEIKTKKELKEIYDYEIRNIRKKRDTMLACWDIMHSAEIKDKIEKLHPSTEVMLSVYDPLYHYDYETAGNISSGDYHCEGIYGFTHDPNKYRNIVNEMLDDTMSYDIEEFGEPEEWED